MNPEEGDGLRSDYRIIHLIIPFVMSGLFSECGEDKKQVPAWDLRATGHSVTTD